MSILIHVLIAWVVLGLVGGMIVCARTFYSTEETAAEVFADPESWKITGSTIVWGIMGGPFSLIESIRYFRDGR